jgi:hypothetical protein
VRFPPQAGRNARPDTKQRGKSAFAAPRFPAAGSGNSMKSFFTTNQFKQKTKT